MLNSFKIEGGHRLSGEITPQGAKNEALQVLCAVLLTDQPVRISNIPDIADVNNQIQLLRQIGVKVTQHSKGDFTFQADEVNLAFLESDEFLGCSAKLRGSIMFVGPLLTRYGRAMVSKPGGDKIGRRRVDTHFLGMEKLGAQLTYDSERSLFRIEAQRLHGAWMLLDEASVTGTANIIMAAVLAEGTTTIYNAACEPYVQQLCRMLNRMGARIEGIASNLLTIHGVNHLSGTTHRILPDMIEVGSFIGMAAMCGDGILIKDVSYDDLGIIPYTFQRLGIQIVRMGDNLYIPRHEHYEIESFIDGSFMTFADSPWPGLTPDLLSVLLVVATQAIDMGAQIILCDPHRAVVVGHDHQLRLRASRMTSPDIRAGIALLIAAMSAEGTSIISNISQIDRGYENIEQRLNALGAKITRIDS